VTQNICDQKHTNNNHIDNPLREFCSLDINSDALLDLIVRYADYYKKTNHNEPACLYYGLTSRKLKLQNSKGTALGRWNHTIVLFNAYVISAWLGWSWRGHLCNELQEKTNWSPKKPGFNPRYSGNVGLVTASFDASE